MSKVVRFMTEHYWMIPTSEMIKDRSLLKEHLTTIPQGDDDAP
jgi:hypothetical protein